jgi:hypothetical protein
MASELLKNRALIQKLKEPDIPVVNFGLADSAIESLIEPDVLPQPKPSELFEERERVRKDRLSDTLLELEPVLMDESVDFIEREEFKQGNPFPITDEVLKEIDDLIKNTNLDLKSIGQKIGYGTDKTQLKIDAPVMKAYIEKYGKPKPGRLKPANLTKDPEYVQFVIDKVKELGGNKKAAAKELGITRKSVNNILKQKAPELMKPENIPGPDTGEKAVKKRAQEIVKEGEKKAGPKTTKQAKQVITNIGNRNKIYANMSAEELAKDKKFLNRLRLKIDGKTGDVNFTGYTEANPVRGKVFNDIELAQHAINKAKDGKLFTHDHITPKRFRKQNIQYPINFQPVTYMENSQFENARTYLTENPDGNVKPIDSYLKSNNKTIRFGKNKYGYTGNIVYNSKTGDQTLLDFEKTPGERKLTAFQELINRKGLGVDPSLMMKAGFEEFVKPAGKFAGQVARGTGTAADLLISAGPGAKGLGLGLLLEADPIITGMTEGKDFGQTARDTIVGSVIDAIPGVNLGSLNEDLIKLADTEEQRVAVQNLIDYQKDYDRFTKDLNAFKSYRGLDQISLDELGFTSTDLVNMENQLAKRFEDIQTRAPKVYNPDVFSLVRELATKEAEKRKENLEGIQGLIFGDRMAKDPDFIDNQIQQILAASTGVKGATDSYADAYKFLPQPKLSLEELDDIYEGGIMGAAEGGRIGFADGPMDPKRRLFLKIMGGIASLPIFGKFLGKSEVAKPIVKVAGSSTKMPDWFPDMINKAMFSGTGKKVDADLTVYEPKELPGISIGRYDDGRVFVEGENAYGKKYMIEYEPPGYELIDEKTGKAVKKPGEFIAQEEVPVNVDPDGNADFDIEVLDDLDQILGPDTRNMEEFATGKVTKTVKDMTGDTGMKKGEYNVGAAEARAEQAAEEAAERLADEAEEAAAALDEID